MSCKELGYQMRLRIEKLVAMESRAALKRSLLLCLLIENRLAANLLNSGEEGFFYPPLIVKAAEKLAAIDKKLSAGYSMPDKTSEMEEQIDFIKDRLLRSGYSAASEAALELFVLYDSYMTCTQGPQYTSIVASTNSRRLKEIYRRCSTQLRSAA